MDGCKWLIASYLCIGMGLVFQKQKRSALKKKESHVRVVCKSCVVPLVPRTFG